ncbi:hypothetical protein GGI25_002049 [Coemansia spiralis]|uniref:Uncharacterized protein n=2 Tax=Coemansia TaxID=4863 RepID=A0A9W8GB11_9FUNG|nr:hypothetical protein BX070DRAFT_37101 [Coemansia spiralis]KAJ1992719.1 hypothetical protein EDC05_002663 [Coemansia umbellata]KAJ2623305.1 hypothetical protein GGI26_002533 [Coemansia sp. RSA 1358]KAJ2678856.1 hypothetical protein GGI25_002049 [Coemansia spiralis]
MKFIQIATYSAIVIGASALPSRHATNAPIAVAPVAFANLQAASLTPLAIVANNDAASARADRDAARDARREERRKEWEEWAHQQGANGASNGTNFVSQILDGVSGIVDSALGPVYSLFGKKN